MNHKLRVKSLVKMWCFLIFLLELCPTSCSLGEFFWWIYSPCYLTFVLLSSSVSSIVALYPFKYWFSFIFYCSAACVPVNVCNNTFEVCSNIILPCALWLDHQHGPANANLQSTKDTLEELVQQLHRSFVATSTATVSHPWLSFSVTSLY